LHIEATRPRDTQVLPARGQHIGRPKALDKSKAALVRRMHAAGEPVTTIAGTLGVSRATVYRVLAEEAGSSDTSP
jgi:DNA invertase Pin-like site-specific DNA recombinase